MKDTNAVKPWAPMPKEALGESAILAVQVPSEMPMIETKIQYQQLLILRVAWLISRWLEESSATVRQTQELLENLQFKLNPYLFSTPTLPKEEGREHLQDWQMEWARLLVVDTGAICHLLTQTNTIFPQKVASTDNQQAKIQGLFQRSVSDTYSLENWLYDLLYAQMQ